MNSLVKFWSEFNFTEPPFIHPQDNSQFGRSREFADRRMFDFDAFIDSDRFPGNEGFHLSLLPMPYVGDLANADIFILLLNPGFNVSNYRSMEDPIYKTRAIKTLLQDFAGTNFPFMSLDPGLASSAGFQWWHKKLSGVFEVISGAKGISYLDAVRRQRQ